MVQSSFPIQLQPFLGLAKNRRYSELAVLRGGITFKNPIWDLKWARYWEGGGIGREAVLGGMVLGGETVEVSRML